MGPRGKMQFKLPSCIFQTDFQKWGTQLGTTVGKPSMVKYYLKNYT